MEYERVKRVVERFHGELGGFKYNVTGIIFLAP